jgi:hypothetical protein
LEDTVSAAEVVARFITQKSYFRSLDKTVRHNAFIPNRNRETSVYRTAGLAHEEIDEIGQRYVASALQKRLLGRAEIIVLRIIDEGLRVVATPKPHYLHANIVDWPEDAARQRMIALNLAAHAHLRLR